MSQVGVHTKRIFADFACSILLCPHALPMDLDVTPPLSDPAYTPMFPHNTSKRIERFVHLEAPWYGCDLWSTRSKIKGQGHAPRKWVAVGLAEKRLNACSCTRRSLGTVALTQLDACFMTPLNMLSQ